MEMYGNVWSNKQFLILQLFILTHPEMRLKKYLTPKSFLSASISVWSMVILKLRSDAEESVKWSQVKKYIEIFINRNLEIWIKHMEVR